MLDPLVDLSADRYRAPALDKGLDILELLAGTEEPMSQVDIAKALDRTPNEIYRMLDRLVRRHYVVRASDDRYELTLKLFVLSHQHAPMRRLVSQALPELRAFSRIARQACHIAVYQRGEVVVVEQVDAPSNWGFGVRVGSRINLFNTGSGRILLAFATPQTRAFMLEEHELLPQETRPADLDEILAEVAARGYVQMASKQAVGVQNLSVPIFGPNRSIVAALSSPHIEWSDETAAPTAEEVVVMLSETADRIMNAMGA